MKIYFLITTSLISDNFAIRKKEYIDAISKLYEESEKYKEFEKEYIIVENNGPRHTFLNDIFSQMSIVYTNNNKLNVNKGIKELLDIEHVFNNFSIGDDDFIVKITGRYIIQTGTKFLKYLFDPDSIYDSIVKLGSIINYNEKKTNIDKFDCYTGLFAIRYKFIKTDIKYYLLNYKNYEWVEWIIISIIHKNIPNHRIKFIDELGLFIKTIDMDKYHLV
jgi:hypothetical protein